MNIKPANISAKSHISISNKFIIYFVFVYIFASLIISGSLYFSSREALLKRTFEQLTSIRTIKKRQIDAFFRDRIKDAGGSNFILSANQYNNHDISIEYLRSYMFDFISGNDYFDGFIIIDSSGKTYHSDLKQNNGTNAILNDFAKKFANSKITNGVSIYDYIYNPAVNKYELYIISNMLRDKGCVYGLRIDNNAINHIMLENNPKEGLGYSGESYLVGDDSLMRSRSRFIENSMLKTKVNTESVKEALADKTGTLLIDDYRTIPVLSSFEKLNIAGLNWVVIAEIDNDEAFQPIKDIRLNIFILSIALSASFLIITYMLTQKITRPLVSLNDATKKLTEGEFVDDLRVVSNDEIGELSVSFSILSDTLKKNRKELENERLKRFSLVMDAQEKEKERLSRELHDGIGQLFIALKLKMESLNSGGIKRDVNFYEVEKSLDDIIAEIRLISNNLMPAVLQELGLIVAIENICRQLSDISSINFNFETDLTSDIADRKKKIYIFRIIQEALNNTVKYSGAANCEIKLIKNTNYKLLISDDGKGFDLDEALKGYGNGLYNMRERVFALDGKINIETSPGNGSLIIINIPG